jgi:hypothetical protein
MPETIIEFAERQGLKMFPVQKVILKAIYGLPLDEEVKFEIWDWNLNEGNGGPVVYTEKSYLTYLAKQGRSNIAEINPEGFNEAVLVLGRRAGKNVLGTCILAYEKTKLLEKDSPQKHYGLPPGCTIQLTSQSPDRDQAAYWHHDSVPFFGTPFATSATDLRFQTKLDPTDRATVRVAFRSSDHKGLRGSSNIAVLFNEMAYYREPRMNYAAAVPSTTQFKGDQRIVSMSTPNGKNWFHELFSRGFKPEERSYMLCLQIPTWEINPHMLVVYMAEMKARDPDIFTREYGAQF